MRKVSATGSRGLLGGKEERALTDSEIQLGPLGYGAINPKTEITGRGQVRREG